MKITLDAPPLNEVVMGVSFLPRQDFLVPYFGAFWELVKEKFPKTAHAPPLFDQDDIEAEDQLFLPRIWLLSADSTTLIQLQQNRFLFNWRVVDGQDNPPYIRFPAMCEEFSRLWKLFEEFVATHTGEPLQPVRFELSYINFISKVSNESSVDLAKSVLRSIAFPTELGSLATPYGFNYQYSAALADELGGLIINTSSAAIKKDVKGIRLELTARKKASSLSFDVWVRKAHDSIVAAFKEITRPEMHRKWKMREE